jgi:hypothetical protein
MSIIGGWYKKRTVIPKKTVEKNLVDIFQGRKNGDKEGKIKA